jgi:hypothetical protein
MMIDEEMNRKKIAPPDIKTLNKRTQVIYNWSGAYDMNDGSVYVGCDEKYATTIIWHEIMHMILFEQFYLEATRMWDNIANDLQEYLFGVGAPEEPYIYKSPPIKAKEMDDGWRLGRKQREKSERVGWKPDTKKRVPIRHIDEIYKAMGL